MRIIKIFYRGFLQFLQIPTTRTDYYDNELHFDLEWLAIARATHSHLSTKPQQISMPHNYDPVSDELLQETLTLRSEKFISDCVIPNIEPTTISCETCNIGSAQFLYNQGNAQTDRIIKALRLEHKWTVPYVEKPLPSNTTTMDSEVPANEDPNEIEI